MPVLAHEKEKFSNAGCKEDVNIQTRKYVSQPSGSLEGLLYPVMTRGLGICLQKGKRDEVFGPLKIRSCSGNFCRKQGQPLKNCNLNEMGINKLSTSLERWQENIDYIIIIIIKLGD